LSYFLVGEVSLDDDNQVVVDMPCCFRGSGTPPDPYAASKLAKRAAWSLAKHGRNLSLRCSALSDRHGASSDSNQRWPLRLNRIVTTDLHAPLVAPLPIGSPARRDVA
jgi:hypothetical protein